MTDVYEFSEFDRQNLIYTYSNMTAEEIAMAREKLKQFELQQAAKKATVPPKPPIPTQEPPASTG